ncbi:putative transcription factor 5qNCA, contains JmjC domain [Handroanthus impetiginosus]|uniref:Putative transcription factor 5qNCA, contains JmjC domain n=1 Tax=Handroanthus impetiginosus TaxID=429701 RepID=A0A2G9GGL3_9LAMI|nr:putative transcription factor 5qNCA, contains JmjC domain [Handroanthus impetiginosus]
MDHPRSFSGGGEDNVGIPDDLRCKRSDGKQWRCTAMSMPDKTVCEKHYIQAKKRAANSAMRASMKKAKRKSLGESDIYLESKSDDMDLPLSSHFGDYSGSSGKKKKEKLSKAKANYSPEMPPVRSFSGRSSLRSTDDLDRDGSEYEDSRRSYRTPPTSAVDSDRSRSQKMFEISPTAETSDGSSESSDDTGAQPCHQCRSKNRDRVIWCLKCDRRGYCESCISTWYSDIPVEDIQRVCPACRGTCSCRLCMRGDNLIKARIREIPVKDKLQYLYSLLSAVLPIVKQIHSEQCSEVELEKKLLGNEIDLARTKLNADEQMCCDFCRIPIVDYHRHCSNCSYDLCLSCCKDIREASEPSIKEEHIASETDAKEKGMVSEHVKLSDVQRNLFEKFSNWKANGDGGIPCPPKAYGGCGFSVLTLKRIFKMNWVAKLVKNVEEMVSGCKISNSGDTQETGVSLRLCQAVHRENDNFLYYPTSEDLKNEGIKDFRMHWSIGKPVIVKEVCDASAMTIWDPMVVWRGIKETAEEKMKDEDRIVKAVDCADLTEINIQLEEFLKGYFDGRVLENGQPQLLKLKDWPSPSASEEFLLYQRPDFISKLPLLEFIHSKWGLLNVAAKLPHYSLQNDVGPKISISYGAVEEIGEGDSTDNLHLNMRDMVFLLVHTCEVTLKGMRRTKTETQDAVAQSDTKELYSNPEIHLNGSLLPNLSPDGRDGSEANVRSNDQEKNDDQGIEENCILEEKAVNSENIYSGKLFKKAQAGALWDVFCREDIPKLVAYISMHLKDFGKADNIIDDHVSRPLYDGVVYLNRHHKNKLKEEFGVEPWSFEQHIGEAVFIPAGCPFQVRHLQSSVQLGLDFLSPESLREALRLSEEIRGLPNDHEVKLQILEVGKISLYAASSAIKEVQKLVLDPKVGPELGFEDPNLTSLVSQNLDNMVKLRQITCA